MAKNKKKKNRVPATRLGGTLGSMGDWCSEHWFLTFLMVGGAMFTVRYVVDSVTGAHPNE